MRDHTTEQPARSPQVSRRGFLRSASAVALATTIGGSALAALTGCSSSGSVGKASSASDVTLPRYHPSTLALSPDLPGTAEGVPSAFYSYPATPARAFSGPPLSGTKISAVTNIFNAPPPGRGANPAWQAVEKRLGATVDITMVIADDYDTKLSTVIAGGSLPDLMLYDGAGMTDLPQFLEAECADLGPLLGGDKIKDYPNLAAIPTTFWEQCTAGGRLYFLPIPRNISGGAGFFHQELLASRGVSSTLDIRDAGDFLSLLKDLTSPASGHYALAGATTNGGYCGEIFQQIFGVPNVWAVDGAGRMTAAMETEQYKASVEFMARVHQAGCFYPGSQGWTKTQMENAFQSGQAAFVYDGLPGFAAAAANMAKINPSFKPMPVIPFGASGGKGVAWQDNVNFAFTMLKKAGNGRLQDILKACDFFASPFGTEEYLLLNYGVAGQDYTLDADHNPILTAQGTNDTQVPWKYLAAPNHVVYNPGQNGVTDVLHQTYAHLVPMALPNPCASLYSPTEGTKGGALTKAFTDAMGQIISGQSPMSGFDAAVKAWQQGGGNAIRSEYEQAYARSGKK